MRFIVTDERVYIAVQHIVAIEEGEGGTLLIHVTDGLFQTRTPLPELLKALKEAGLEVPA